MARAAGSGILGRRAVAQRRAAAGWRAPLGSAGAGGMGGPMAPDMNPPAGVPEVLTAAGWGGAGGWGGRWPLKRTPPAGFPEFLTAAGGGGAEVRPLAGEASFRRYFRVVEHDRSAILMDAPPPQEDPRPFIAIAEWLTGRG